MNVTINPVARLAARLEDRSAQSITRRVGANSARLLLARVITQLQLFGFTLLVAHGLGAAGFGQYAFVAAVLVVGNVATTFGTDTMLIRDGARAASATLIPATLWLQLALSAVWLVAIFFGAAALTGQSLEVVSALELYSLSLIPLAFFTVFTSVLRAHERMDLYLLLNGLMAAFQFGGAWLILTYDPRLVSLILMLVGVQVFGALLAGAICRFGLPAFKLNATVTRRQLQQIVRLAWPFALLSVLAGLYQRLGVLLVSALSGDEPTGWFTAAARVIEPLKIVHLSVLGALLPALSRLAAATSIGAQSNVGARLFRRAFFGLLAISAAMAVSVSMFAQPIVTLLYSTAYAPSISILQVLAFSLIPYAISASLAVRFVTQGRERRLMWITALTLLIAFVLNRWLVPIHGSIGAAVTVVVAECFQAGALLWVYFKLGTNAHPSTAWRTHHSAQDATAAAPTDQPDAPIMTARDLLAYRWRQTRAPRIAAPPAVIVCYQREPLAHLIKQHRATRVDGFFGEFHVLKVDQTPIGVLRPIGPGAPIAAMVLEELIACGAKRFISIGLAGGLQLDLQPGNIVVCDRALRDEGTSDHYLPPAPAIDADPDLVQQLSAKLLNDGVAHRVGASWTTDAPFRETRSKVRQQRDAGVLTVEMEAAALLTVAQHFNVAAAAIFVIGDNLADLVWQPAEDMRPLNHSLNRVAECVAEVLSTE